MKRRESQPRAAGALDDVKARRDQRIAAEGEDHRRGVERPEAPERRIFEIEVERREGELERDEQPRRHPRDPPEQGRDDAPAHRIVVVEALVGGHLQNPARNRAIVGARDGGPQHREARESDDHHMHRKRRIDRQRRRHEGKQGQSQPGPRPCYQTVHISVPAWRGFAAARFTAAMDAGSGQNIDRDQRTCCAASMRGSRTRRRDAPSKQEDHP